MNRPWNHDFEFDDADETELLEASTGFSLLEEEQDNSEMLQVLERQISTLQVQLDNLEEDLARLTEGPDADSAQAALVLRLRDQADRLAARIDELESQANTLSAS
ncbi:MAG: hypothetical protein MSB10_12760 [Clostridiales bacterium]|uniref:hypothetical protein n=1 Tax=Flavonifractor porci TaxID=3133422 RepID=UPI0030A0EA26|nr:hypothetical protein [Clostridiales bacterium]